MAREVLDQNTEGYVHRLHHDLESVFYMCVWHAFDYTPKNGPRRGQLLYGWRSIACESILWRKVVFLTSRYQGKITLKPISNRTHRHKCYYLYSAFQSASVKSGDEIWNYFHVLYKVHKDMQAAWKKKNPCPSNYAVYVTFPVIMGMLGEEAKACTKDCCVRTTSESRRAE